jgi:hypothetical protein
VIRFGRWRLLTLRARRRTTSDSPTGVVRQLDFQARCASCSSGWRGTRGRSAHRGRADLVPPSPASRMIHLGRDLSIRDRALNCVVLISPLQAKLRPPGGA